jgi:hypothetical protein
MASRVPAALRARLEDDATFGLIEFMDAERKTWSEEVLAAAANRFDVRLTNELSALRRDVTQELVTTRVDMLRWSFVFWIGQVVAVTGLLAYMLRR